MSDKKQKLDIVASFSAIKTLLTINKIKKQMNPSKLASRKLWVTIGGASLVSISSFLLISMGVSEEMTTQLVGWVAKIVLGYAGAQGLVDVAEAIRTGKEIASKAGE